MKLTKVVIANYRSVTNDVELAIDGRVTALLGSNDHGKTNLLEAIRHLNDDRQFLAEDMNWNQDPEAHQRTSPRIRFHFQLPDGEVAKIRELLEPAPHPHPDMAEARDAEMTQLLAGTSFLGGGVTYEREGVGQPLKLLDVPDHPELAPVRKYLNELKPRVELFVPPPAALPDSATADSINGEPLEFMQGIFYLAGLDPKNAKLFTQSERSVKELEEASVRLNRELEQRWTQGRDLKLQFKLQHSGSHGSIELYVDDPAVKTRKVRISKRSTGVTQFFRMAMTLHARRQKIQAANYIYLFDEPGTNLHPQGQRDLLQVFERFADSIQIAYATHSIFLLNHNFPERHRLIYKDGTGTRVDQKGAKANWKYATSSMGVALPPTVYFCTRILLVEGDSDVIYMYELLRQLNRLGLVSVDANFLGILSYGDAGGIRYLVQMFRRSDDDATAICLVGDGDKDGGRYVSTFREVQPSDKWKGMQLDEHTSIEDYCLYPDQYRQAVIQAGANLVDGESGAGIGDKQAELRALIEPAKEKGKTLGKHVSDATKKVFRTSVSKTTVARVYAELCRNLGPDAKPGEEETARAVALVKRLNEVLGLPETRADVSVVATSESRD